MITYLLIFPHAGGGILYYNKWRMLLSKKSNVTIIQYPMREQKMNQHMPESLEILAEDIFLEYESLFNDKCIIWGHSMGSFVAYEVLKLMEDYLDVFPKRFYSSGAAAPCSVRKDLFEKVNNKGEFYELLKNFGGIDFTLLSDEDFVEFFLPTIKTDMILVSQYTDKCIRKIKCPIVLMEGTEDKCDISQWVIYAENSLKTVYFKGNHFFIEENVSEVIKILERGIEDEI